MLQSFLLCKASSAMGRTFLITGGAGFIGSEAVRQLVARGDTVINLDKLTYAGNLASLDSVASCANYHFVHGDICDAALVNATLKKYQPTMILHLAAESHVDRSILGPADFVQTNIVGTYVMLEQALGYWRQLPQELAAQFRFVHVSTDEVFGSLGETGAFHEGTPYSPRSPYSASKASSDHLAMAWFHTFGLPVVQSNCSNNYGPYQNPEKMIPVLINNALRGLPLPIYGKGQNIRDWLHVKDHVRALVTIAERGIPGESYNVGANGELQNLELAKRICALLDEIAPPSTNGPHSNLLQFVEDRPGHDFRYAIDSSKLRRELGWAPAESLETGLRSTVQWYLEHQDWVTATSKSFAHWLQPTQLAEPLS